MYYKMLKSVVVDGEEFNEGELYELDQETAKKWTENGRCEEAADPADALYEKVTSAVEDRINKAVSKLADSIKTKTEPVFDVVPEKKSLGDFLKCFATDKTKLANKYGEKVLSVGTDTAVIPTPLFTEILQADKGLDNVYDLVRRVPMTSDTMSVPVLNQAVVSPSGGSSAYFGSVVGSFDSEDEDANDTEPAWASRTLNASRYTMSTIQTLEFQQDTIVGETALVDLLRKAYRDHMSYYILQGSSPMEGVIDHAATVDVSRDGANEISWGDITTMLGRMASVDGNWTWLCSPTAYAALLELESSGGYPLVQPQLHNSLYGLPIIKTEHAKALGTAGDLVLFNGLKGYILGERMEAEVSFSDHVGWLKSRRYWKLVARVDGLPVHADTITLADGSTEAGDVIQLDAVGS